MDEALFSQVNRLQVEEGTLEYGVTGKSDAPALLLLHGIRNTKLLFAPILPRLAERYRVIAVDIRGHGNSVSDGSFSFERIVTDLIQLLDAEQLEQVTIVAASFSAVPAQMLAIREPKRVASLVLLDGGYYSLGEVPGFNREKVVERLATTRFSSVEEAERQFAERYGTRVMPEGWMRDELLKREDDSYGYRLPREAFSAYFKEYSVHSQPEMFQQLTCPVLLLLADDSLLSKEEQQFHHQAVANYQGIVKQAKVKMIQEAQHLLMVTHPQETVNEIQDFLLK
ncbi:alpha/beta fold hydrolase [Brevibacillus porteri]|uniref:Alpha/beta hydrolase n=1 Tax=Brevibacillus porteri TaxID=2126350 RepID=A0ABX5FPR4_9BACL|nr:alpha/beta hydrolase [Brevibacillus porteri]MED1800360.1 alpha/beta hydrolase [Brevibacillus porteri]MED2134059.1 alpha/beta hydrolase [Brevibacillus porteri]MED2745815.1 alpha/beta hydrolase [Brevibacillus porteri]MED2813003.1 alpha/beta hydrolase [Brevibacillus porteri]MED2893303.1 alpha/beta hydrolase [Brevibacillus porteri]